MNSLKRYWKRILLGVVLVLLVLVAWKTWQLGRIGWSMYQQLQTVQAIAADPATLDPATVKPLVSQTRQDLANLQRELGPFAGLFRRMGWLPTVGGEVAALPELLGFAAAMGQVGEVGVTALDPALRQIDPANPDPKALLPAVVTALDESAGDFTAAQQAFEQAQTYRAAINTETLSPQIARRFDQLDQATPVMEIGLAFAPVAGQLLGAEQPQTYLLVLQNSDELRPTGGLLTAIGTLVIDRGEIVDLTFEDSYAVDDLTLTTFPPAPPQLQKYMLAPYWVFRDTNWWPDFPTSVAAMLDIYHLSRDTQIDGVIALDMLALQEIIGALEPLTIDGWEQPATRDNVLDLIRGQWSPDEADETWRDWYDQRKDFIGDLAAALRTKVEANPRAVDWPKMLDAVLATLTQRHVQIWLADPAAQSIVAAQGWDGAVPDVAGDYLLAVDANIGFNKANAAVTQALAYNLDLTEPDSPQAMLTVTHRNPSKLNDPCLQAARAGHDGADYREIVNRCYWNYLRVYTPPGSELTGATPHAISGEFLISGRAEPPRVVSLPPEAGKSVWGTLLLVPHGETVVTQFNYTLPADILQQTDNGTVYHLTWQKQAGTVGHPTQVMITLPAEAEVVAVSPSPTRQTGNTLLFDLNLTTDFVLDVTYQ